MKVRHFVLSMLIVYAAADAFAVPLKLVVKNARLLTMAPQQRDPFTGYLAIGEDGTIVAVAKGDPPATLKAAQVVDAHGDWVFPGFISAHSHLWQAAYRGLAADSTLMGWLGDLYTKRAQQAPAADFYWFCLQGALDHLQHGITAAYDFNYSRVDPSGSPFDEAQFRAELKSGMRFVHGYEAGWVAPGITIDLERDRLKKFLAWTAIQPRSSTFLSVMINGDTAFNDTYQQAVLEKALMDEFHLRNQSHYLEPPEANTVTEERNKFPWFVDSGLLNDQLIFGHFLHPDQAILEATAKAGVAMTWNPLSNGRMASGVADIPAYLKLGLRIGMGIDGEASGDLADPFENMRAGLYAVRDKYGDATVLSPYQVFWLHTMGSADVLGVKDRLGSLEPGKFGDFVMVDPSRLGAVLEDPYANLVLVTGERDIDRVYVGGELKVDHGQLLHQDMSEVERVVSQRVVHSEDATSVR